MLRLIRLMGLVFDSISNSRRAVYSSSVLALLFLLVLSAYGLSYIYAVEYFSKHEAPFGKSYDEWLAEYWNWFMSLDKGDIPESEGCLIHESGSMVMLSGANLPYPHPNQVCEISSDDGLMIPLWIAWCDEESNSDKVDGSAADLDAQLTKCAREAYNLGIIEANVVVDNKPPVAKLAVELSLSGNSLVYENKTQNNVNEIFSKGFELTISPDQIVEEEGLPSGTFRAGSHGWWAFLKPLPPGNHTVTYDVFVIDQKKIGTINPVTKATIRYSLDVI